LSSLVLALAAALAACGDEPGAADAAGVADAVLAVDAPVDASPAPDAPSVCDSETRDDVYAPGLAKTGPAGYVVRMIESIPAPPARGNNEWTLEVLAPAGPGQPGLGLTAVPFMPDHGHGTTIVAEDTDLGAGRYRLTPVNLFMRGFWTVRVGVRAEAGAGAELDVVTFAFCVI
jgi:hypothetical protein